MKLDQANKLIQLCAEQMNARYRKVVFDEWAVISLTDNKGRLLSTWVPGRPGSRKTFSPTRANCGARCSLSSLTRGISSLPATEWGPGLNRSWPWGGIIPDLQQYRPIHGRYHQDPLWLSAQVPFVDLSERFRNDPLVVVSREPHALADSLV